MYDSRDFTVGGVVRQTFELIGRHFGGFAACAFVLMFLPSLASFTQAVNTVTRFDGAGQLRDTTTSVSFLGSSSGIVVLLTSLVLFGIVIRAALGDFRGERPSLRVDVGASLRLFLPNLVIAVLYYLGVVLGYTLLVVPGAMLQSAWLVTIPAYMAERPGLFRAFGRSRALTKGYRWRLFGLLLLYGLAFAVVGGVNFFVTLSLTRNGIGGGGLWTFRILTCALSAALNLIGSAGAAVCYFELSRVKGGVLSAQVVEAFA